MPLDFLSPQAISQLTSRDPLVHSVRLQFCYTPAAALSRYSGLKPDHIDEPARLMKRLPAMRPEARDSHHPRHGSVPAQALARNSRRDTATHRSDGDRREKEVPRTPASTYTSAESGLRLPQRLFHIILEASDFASLSARQPRQAPREVFVPIGTPCVGYMGPPN
jgi:hypothetical protein